MSLPWQVSRKRAAMTILTLMGCAANLGREQKEDYSTRKALCSQGVELHCE
jgi:hypothetical protein